jgi:hypothetical protein
MSTIAASRGSSSAAVTAKRPTVSEGAVGLRAAATQAKKHVTLGNISNVHVVGERVAGNRKVAAMPGNTIRITRAISRGIIAGDLGFRFLPFVFLDQRHSVSVVFLMARIGVAFLMVLACSCFIVIGLSASSVS